MINNEYGPNITNQMWATYGKNVAQSTMTNLGVNQNMTHICCSKCDPVILKQIRASFVKDEGQ